MTQFRIYYETLGGHVHMRVFAGEAEGSLGLAGTLVLRQQEFDDLTWMVHSANIKFINEKSV